MPEQRLSSLSRQNMQKQPTTNMRTGCDNWAVTMVMLQEERLLCLQHRLAVCKALDPLAFFHDLSSTSSEVLTLLTYAPVWHWLLKSALAGFQKGNTHRATSAACRNTWAGHDSSDKWLLRGSLSCRLTP